MRYLIVAVLCLSIHCHGPKSARGEDAPAAPPKKESYTAAVQRFEATVAGLAETQGNTNAELESLRTTLGTKIDAVEKRLGKLESLLSADAELSIEVPKAADPPQVDAPPTEAADRRTVTFHGKPIDVAEWLATKLTKQTRIGIGERDTGNRAMVEQHLRYHGLEGDFSKYSREQLITLHSVAHLKDGTEPMKAAKSKTVVRAVVPQASYGGGCANGQCQRPMTYYFRSRRR